jgi:hypothetical protein
MPVAIALVAVAAATAANTAYQSNQAMHARHKVEHDQAVERGNLEAERKAIDMKSMAEADARFKRNRAGTGRDSTVATSSQGLLNQAPVAQASLQGKQLLGA